MLIIRYIYVDIYITYKIQKGSNLEPHIVYSFPKIHMIKLCICFSLAPLRLTHFNPVRVQLYFVIFFLTAHKYIVLMSKIKTYNTLQHGI